MIRLYHLKIKDHPLIWNFKGFMGLHIAGDILVIYMMEKEIELVFIGSHSQLFN
ncbi:MAG: type II toxin-antitoxin system mRNA interferase toxin, RelE/StbE family [Hydrogenothermaceae bacterium]